MSSANAVFLGRVVVSVVAKQPSRRRDVGRGPHNMDGVFHVGQWGSLRSGLVEVLRQQLPSLGRRVYVAAAQRTR